MGWQLALAVGSGLMAYGSSKRAAREAKRQAERQAAAILLQRFAVEELATQQHVDRMESFRDLVNTNNAYAAYMGRSDRSIQALRKEEGRKYGRDVDRIKEQSRREIQKLRDEAQAVREQGRVTSKQYRNAANATLFNTVISAATMLGSTPSTTSGNVPTTPGNTGTGAAVTVSELRKLP
jgi:hypothetical protein